MLLCSVVILLAGCVNQTVKSTAVPSLDSPSTVYPDSEILDVGVAVFDPGIDALEEDDYVFPEVRRAEARFVANELRATLQDVGAWGAVRVVPDTQQFTDLLVQGTILQSDGEVLKLQVAVTDARGVLWLDKTYEGVTSRYAYSQSTRTQQDPFLQVYRDIANDMLAVYESLGTKNRETVRHIAEMRFARNFAPDAFEGYIEANSKGIYQLQRLPAPDDPMLERVRNLRQRNYVFIDTLQGYYSGFAEEMYSPYQEWRKQGYQEITELRELQAESRAKLIAGGAALIAGIAAQGSDNRVARSAGMVSMIGGGSLLKTGLEKRAEAKMHTLALEEIGQSLEAEITPKVIELEDRTVRLSGNVEDQYAQWRELLADIYAAEMGALLPQEAEPPLAETSSPQTASP
jgi:hypothetical protein